MDRRVLLQLWLGAALVSQGRVWAAAPRLTAADRLDLEGLLAAFGWSLDTGDPDALVRTMTPDGVVVDRRGKRWDPSGFAAQYAGNGGRRGRQHEVQINAVRQEPDGAVGVQSYWATVIWKEGEAAPLIDALGVYTDRCVKSSGAWLVSERRIGTWDSSTIPSPKL